MINKRSVSFVLSLAVLAMIACMFTGGCGGSSGSFRASSNRDQLIAAIGDVADDLQAIANSALANGKIVNALNEITSQYIVLDAKDSTLPNRVIGRTFLANDVTSRELTGNPSFDIAVYVKALSNKHITVENGIVTSFVTGQSDFQLTITSNDTHVTKLTITPNSTTGYWQALTALSAVAKVLFAEAAPEALSQLNPLLLVYTYSSSNVKVEYDGTVLLEGTLTIDYPTKTAVTPDTLGEPVFLENNTHTAKCNFTLHPQDNKDYDVKFDLDSNAQLVGSNSMSNSSTIKLYRQMALGATRTLIETNVGLDVTVPSGYLAPSIPSAATLRVLNMKIADRIRIAETGTLNVARLIDMYLTRGSDASEATLESNAREINTLLSNAGVSLYLNGSANKVGDIRAAVDTLQGSRYIHLGVQFTGSDEVEFVKDIANPDDLNQIKTLIGNVSGQARALAQLFTNLQIAGNLNNNAIISIIFKDLFGSN